MGLMGIPSDKWYAKGLRFKCLLCGRCCAGPEEGYVWLTGRELSRAAEFLKMSPEAFREKFVRRVRFRMSLREHPQTKDCIFLTDIGLGRRGCAIYPVRPLQCCTWPFWTENLRSIYTWEKAAAKCPGINHGPLWSFEEIERRRTAKSGFDGLSGADSPAGSAGL
jgi:hypothetical protein